MFVVATDNLLAADAVIERSEKSFLARSLFGTCFPQNFSPFFTPLCRPFVRPRPADAPSLPVFTPKLLPVVNTHTRAHASTRVYGTKS